MVKPDGVRRGLIGDVIGRLERKGLKLLAMKMMNVSPELAAQHYAEHRDKSFYPELARFITGGPVVAMVWEGHDAVAVVRILMGSTDPAKADPGTIRGDLGLTITENIVHGSDSDDAATREMALYFHEGEIAVTRSR